MLHDYSGVAENIFYSYVLDMDWSDYFADETEMQDCIDNLAGEIEAAEKAGLYNLVGLLQSIAMEG